MRSVFLSQARPLLHVSLEAGEPRQAECVTQGESLSLMQVRVADHLDRSHRRSLLTLLPLIPPIRSKKKVRCRRSSPLPIHLIPFTVIEM